MKTTTRDERDQPMTVVERIRYYRSVGKFKDAFDVALDQFKQEPYNTQLWHELGTCMMAVKEYARATQILSAAMMAEPHIPVIPYQLGWIAEAEGKYLDAAKWYARAVSLYKAQPNVFENECKSWFGLGSCLFRLGKRDEGEHYLRQGLHWRADSPEARFQRGNVKLSLGQYTGDAWDDYDARWEIGHFRASQEALHKADPMKLPPRWDGTSPGKLLAIAEQGSGDTLMCLRYLPKVHGVVIQAHTVTLAQQLYPDTPVWPDGECPEGYDWSVPMLSLPRYFGRSVDTLPRVELRPTGRPPKRIGVCWKGQSEHLNDKDRSSPIDFREALNSTDYELVSLQVGEGFSPKDYLETVDVLRTLDAVVTVDTSVAHLAGLLGVPTLLIPPTSPEWRWPLRGERCSWYPSVRLARRRTWNDWPEALGRVKDQLARML